MSGCGKSYLLQVIIDTLQQKFGYAFMVAVTATTGMAASRINGVLPLFIHIRKVKFHLSLGQTIHSWAGLTGSEVTIASALKQIKSSPHSPSWDGTRPRFLFAMKASLCLLSHHLFSLLSYCGCFSCMLYISIIQLQYSRWQSLI